MDVTSEFSEDNNTLTISIVGRFDFSCLQQFRIAYANAEQKPAKYVLNLGGADYLDSSALGMLLALRDFAGGDDADISITNCTEDVKKILKITKLNEIFKIE